MSINGKVVLVAGAGQCIRRAITLRLANDGTLASIRRAKWGFFAYSRQPDYDDIFKRSFRNWASTGRIGERPSPLAATAQVLEQGISNFAKVR